MFRQASERSLSELKIMFVWRVAALLVLTSESFGYVTYGVSRFAIQFFSR